MFSFSIFICFKDQNLTNSVKTQIFYSIFDCNFIYSSNFGTWSFKKPKKLFLSSCSTSIVVRKTLSMFYLSTTWRLGTQLIEMNHWTSHNNNSSPTLRRVWVIRARVEWWGKAEKKFLNLIFPFKQFLTRANTPKRRRKSFHSLLAYAERACGFGAQFEWKTRSSTFKNAV